MGMLSKPPNWPQIPTPWLCIRTQLEGHRHFDVLEADIVFGGGRVIIIQPDAGVVLHHAAHVADLEAGADGVDCHFRPGKKSARMP